MSARHLVLVSRPALLVALLFAAASAARADDTAWHAALDIGQSHFNESAVAASSKPSGSSSIRINDTGYRVSVGYRFTPHLGFEMGYVDLGKAEDDVSYAPDPSRPAFRVADRNRFQSNGWMLSAVGTSPLGSAWSITGRVGLILSHTEYDHKDGQFGSLSFDDTKRSLQSAVGGSLAWGMTQHSTLRLSVDYFPSLDSGRASGGTVDAYLMSVGLVFAFP